MRKLPEYLEPLSPVPSPCFDRFAAGAYTSNTRRISIPAPLGSVPAYRPPAHRISVSITDFSLLLIRWQAPHASWQLLLRQRDSSSRPALHKALDKNNGAIKAPLVPRRQPP